MHIWDWLVNHWEGVATTVVVISETLAFIPTKAKGVIHTIVLIGNAIFKKKTS